MRAISPVCCVLVLVLSCAGVFPARGESATVGWEAAPLSTGQPPFFNFTTGDTGLEGFNMRGPTGHNEAPKEKKGVFHGEFYAQESNTSKLTAVFKISMGKDGELRSSKVKFVMPAGDKESFERNGMKKMRFRFETEALEFEPGEFFLLVFESDGKAGGGREMFVLRIQKLFVMS